MSNCMHCLHESNFKDKQHFFNYFATFLVPVFFMRLGISTNRHFTIRIGSKLYSLQLKFVASNNNRKKVYNKFNKYAEMFIV